MKIAIPVDEKSIESIVGTSFGRTPYFLIYDTDHNESTFIYNSAAESAGGAGIKAAQIIVDHEAHVLLTPRCGENAADVLKTSDIVIFKTQTVSAKENLSAYLAEKLPLLNEIHSGFHGHGEN